MRKGATMKNIVTDRHSQIQTFLWETHKDLCHWFDVWHVAKGIKKQLLALSKMAGCEAVLKWSPSITNHIYWSAASSKGNTEECRQKWMSIANHVVNVHEGHGDAFTACLCDELVEEREWLIKGSKAHKELLIIVNSKMLLKDIGNISPIQQTSSLEAYHKVELYFAPKASHFSHKTMKASFTFQCKLKKTASAKERWGATVAHLLPKREGW
ncbi:uncharacterized protein LOC133481025 [Phyllopteryx taeniolatus]|uniref:uncharacterized protein LOC133481025 n=1 Tax=Phyllopteryx taeniolatus TaxID=161469 RepID=UPI002AD36B04|nr:uncharacterized protein LOC133481025 [Phyllopteryx taeniolatus]